MNWPPDGEEFFLSGRCCPGIYCGEPEAAILINTTEKAVRTAWRNGNCKNYTGPCIVAMCMEPKYKLMGRCIHKVCTVLKKSV